MTYKVIDQITGKEFWSDDMIVDWDGSIRHKDNADGMHPDYQKKNLPPEKYPRFISQPVYDVYVTASVTFYAGTDVPRLRE